MRFPFFKSFLLISFICVTAASIHAPSIHAVTVNSSTLNPTTTCNAPGRAQFTALVAVPNDTYDVYVRLPTAGQTADVHVYGQNDDADSQCMPIGSLTANGSSWTKVGTWNETLGDLEQSLFEVTSNNLSSTLSANRPSVMLVSTTHPTCVPTTECYVSIGQEQGYIRPIGTLQDHNSLHVLLPEDPSTEMVKDVTYYVDDTAVTTTKTIEPFDLRYVSLPTQSLTRVIEYTSGQEIILQDQNPSTHSDSFVNFIFRIYELHTQIFYAGIILAAVLLLGFLPLRIRRAVGNHRLWRIEHGFIKQKVSTMPISPELAYQKNKRVKKVEFYIQVGLGIAGIIAVIVLINSYAATLYTVNGMSMESTFHNKSEVIVNKLPVTWAHLRNVDYFPKRGDVVIVNEIFGVTDDNAVTQDLGQTLIKRVIGLPGDHVVVANNTITIYNQDHPNGFNPDLDASWAATMHASKDNEQVDVTLAKDELFIAGDNRPVSVDSRFNGPILAKQVIGVVVKP